MWDFKKNILILISTIIASLTIYFSVNLFTNQNSYIEVKGLSEKIVKADIGSWTIGFQTKSNDVNELYHKVEKQIKIVRNFLKDMGFKDTEISVSPINIWYHSYRDAEFKYTSNTDISIYTEKVDLVKSSVSKTRKLLSLGIILNRNDINYSFTKLNTIKPEMIAEATKNAEKAAEEFTKNTGTEIGKIVRARQGVFTINDKNPASPEWKKVRIVSTLRYLIK